nr:hypothetical protein [Candidatus Freyarchaeota archaeon]
MSTLDILIFTLNCEILITILMIVVIATILWRFAKKRSAALLYLALFFILFTLGVYFAYESHRYQLSMYIIIIQDYMLNGIFMFFNVHPSLYATIANSLTTALGGYLIGSILTLTFSVTLAELGCLFLFAFTLKAFLERKRKWMLVYSLIFVPTFILTLTSLNRTSDSMLALIIGLITCIPLAYLSIKASGLTKKKAFRYGFLMIAATTVFLILFFAFNFVEGVVAREASIFMPIAWTMGLLASITAYIGYVLPNWFRRLVGEKPEEINQAEKSPKFKK